MNGHDHSLKILLTKLRLEGFKKVDGFFEIPVGNDFPEELDLFGMSLVLNLREANSTFDYLSRARKD